MLSDDILIGSAFIAVTSGVLLLYLVMRARHSRLEVRLEQLSASSSEIAPLHAVRGFAQAALPRVGAPLIPPSAAERTELQARLVYAGYYSKQAMLIFLGTKVLLAVGCFVAGILVGAAGIVNVSSGALAGALLGTAGLILPGFWLDHRKSVRQIALRRALPDALDVLVICLEGGASVPSGLQRVSTELRAAHPKLAAEFAIVQREIQMGRSVGEALRSMAERTDLEEIRTISAVIQQSERFGASLVKSLRVHAETLRIQRLQRAEEMAQKATIKLLIPTILFIFPTILLVVLGPPVVEFVKMVRSMKLR